MLVLGIHHAHRMVRVSELNQVLAQVVRGAVELVAQRVVDPGFEMRAPGFFATDTDVFGKQIDVGIEVAHIQRQRIFAGQLTDLINRFQSVKAGKQGVLFHKSVLIPKPCTARCCARHRPASWHR